MIAEDMQATAELSRTEKFKDMILSRYDELIESAQEVMEYLFEIGPALESNPEAADTIYSDQDSRNAMNSMYSGCLILWVMLEPKMEGKNSSDFKEFEQYVHDPLSLRTGNDIMMMLRSITKALHDLDITNLPVKA